MFINLGQRKLYYKVTGKGPTILLLLHGGPGLTLDYLRIIHDMLPEDEFTVISYNQSGSSGNENSPFYKSVKAYALELNQVMEELKLKKPYVLGHSWGGAVLQEYLVHYPNQVAGAILANTFSSGKRLAETIKDLSQKLPQDFQSKLVQFADDGDALDGLIFEYWLPNYFCRLPEVPHDLITSLSTVRDCPVQYYFVGTNLISLNGALLSWDRTAYLNKISVPVLVMSGTYDNLPRQDFDALVSTIPNAVGWYGYGTSHTPMYEQTESFRETLIRFMKSVT